MPAVETATGSVDSTSLGRTLMHEHLFVTTPELHLNYPGRWGAEDDLVEDAVQRLAAVKEAGFDTLVDVTVLGLGRDLPRVRRVADQVAINIVVATGVYTFHDVPLAFQAQGPGTELGGPEPMTEMFVGDIVDGVGDTGIRAGILKCATDEPGLTPGVQRVLRAVAQAHRQTGVPISTHTHAASRRGLDQQRVFAEEGVDLSRVVIGHSGDTTDLDYLEELIANGSYVGMDRFGLDMIVSFEDRVATVAALCSRGHAGRIVLSHDACCHTDEASRAVLEEAIPSWHYLHIAGDVLPALRRAGVTEGQIDQMLVDNPRAILERQGGY
jgi:phosphotriesterase-related protein